MCSLSANIGKPNIYDNIGNRITAQEAAEQITYAENHAVKFESADGNTIITCADDYMGRRFEKKVTTNGTVTLRRRYLYRRGEAAMGCRRIKTPDGKWTRFWNSKVTAQWGNTWLSEGKDIKLISDQFLNIHFCKNCTLELLACHLGESEHHKEHLEENTGYTVVLYTGRVNAFFPF